MAGIQALIALSYFQRYQLVERIETDFESVTSAEADRVDGFVSSMTSVMFLAYFVIFVLLVTWLFKLTKTNRTNGANFSKSNGWAIGGFFIPFANLFIPYKFLKENIQFRQLKSQSAEKLNNQLKIWWFSYLGATVLARAVTNMPGETASELKASDATSIVGALVFLVACVFAAQVVKGVTPEAN